MSENIMTLKCTNCGHTWKINRAAYALVEESQWGVLAYGSLGSEARTLPCPNCKMTEKVVELKEK